MGERVVHENNVAVWHLSALASEDLKQVTTGELAGGVRLPELTADGLNINPSPNNASIPMLDSGKIAQKPGTRQMGAELRFARNKGGDIAWDLYEYGLDGYLVVHRFGHEPEAGADLEVYKYTSHDPQPMASGQDTYQQFVVPLAIEDWELKAELVAGS